MVDDNQSYRDNAKCVDEEGLLNSNRKPPQAERRAKKDSKQMVDTYFWTVAVFSLVFFGTVIFYAVQNLRAYFKKEAELNAMDEKYDAYKSHRVNLLQHYYWSLESGERESAEKIKDELIDLDDEMEALKEKFEFVSQKKEK